MPKLSSILRQLAYPAEVRALITYKLYYEPDYKPEEHPQESGVDRQDMRRCWEFLDLTSRSFAMVCRQVHGELGRVICLFYLVLRALDTIEDDMTIDIEVKKEQLVNFHEKLYDPKQEWHFDDCGPNEKDRQLLVEFYVVIREFQRLDKNYQTVITNVCRTMGRGMAHYCLLAHRNSNVYSVTSLKSFDLYCHHVAGIVGEGLSSLFSASGVESPDLGSRLTLSNSMGLLLQKVNILRDFREDVDEGRLFWPKEIWGKYASHPREFYPTGNKELDDKKRWALSEMVLDALMHATDALDYLSLLKTQTVFNFCAIPQVMAMATLAECFGNLQVYQRNVKIRKGTTVQLIMRSTNPRDVAYIFLYYMRDIARKRKHNDPCFLKLGIMLGRIEQWCESHYPSFVTPSGINTSDPRFRQLTPDTQALLTGRTPARAASHGQGPAGADGRPPLDSGDYKFMATVLAGVLSLVLFASAVAFGAVYFIWLKDDEKFQAQMWENFKDIRLSRFVSTAFRPGQNFGKHLGGEEVNRVMHGASKVVEEVAKATAEASKTVAKGWWAAKKSAKAEL